LEYSINEVLDINGWDIDKTLKLLHASNPTLFEWSNSPVVYKTTELVETQLEPELKPVVDNLLKLKMSASEIGETPKIALLNKFIEQNLSLIRKRIEALPKEPPSDWKPLNALFLSILEGEK
jgi:predicted nucleotidyltransferase